VVILTILVAAVVIGKTPETHDLETRKLRIATVTLTGLLVLFLFVAVLHFVDREGAGRDIFDKAYTAMLTLAGAISGYVFSAKKKNE
jgi:hypothetical protein